MGLPPDPFRSDIPPTDHEILRSLWGMIIDIKAQVERTNGRVSSLEKYRWAAMGGITVVTAVVVPIFLKLVFSP